ncbi:MAG TPA: TMAO reductase system periplasmic protein TorT [Jiangellales bacterium]|nr:TMAO reductase system periplasmic protein TorT [Jiangellales bacterium]
MRSKHAPAALTVAVVLGLLVSACGSSQSTDSSGNGATGKSWAPVKVDVWQDLSMDSTRSVADYTPVDKASKPWRICVSFPHLKDAYWLGVAYGAAEQAKAAGVNMTLVEAGGYENLDKQIQQIEDCSQNADALVIGAISYDGLNNTVSGLKAKGKPVIDVINGMSSPDVTAKSLVSFGELATITADWLVDKTKGDAVKVAWFPGPKGAGWAEAGEAGFKKAAQGSNVTIVDTKWGDTGKEAQSKLIEDALAANPDIDYIVGTAVTAEAAVPILKDRGLADKIGVLGYYFTPGTYQGIKAGSIQAAPSDSMVIQARIAIDQAIRALDEKDFMQHVGPQLFVVDSGNVNTFPRDTSLAPDGWSPVFSVKADG